ncbi:MAG TPA: SEC-C metal-binding domain-containing protein, partial [Gemmatimonadales bacterium]|nr:SEC-C metal-binding domain-containing protein [Gemmatimonadales bacterium]
MNQQREVIYSQRLYALEGGEELKAEAQRMIDSAVAQLADSLIVDHDDPAQWDRALIETEFLQKFLMSVPGVTDPAVVRNREELVRAAQQAGRDAFQKKVGYLKDVEARVGAANLSEQALSHVTLGVIDEKWKDHLYDLDQLREGIYYRAWGQKDPLVEYKQDAYEMFVGLMHDLQTTFAERWFKLQVEIGPPPGQGGQRPPSRGVTGPAGGLPGPSHRQTPMVASKPAADGLVTSAEPPPPSVQRSRGGVTEPAFATNPYAGVGRNDPCPCGSGKKFKKCHGAGA